MELGTREGMESTSYPAILSPPPPRVSSYLFLLPVYDAPSSAERNERIGEEERRGREGDGLSIFIMFAPKKERQEERGKKERERKNGSETVGIHVYGESVRDGRTACKNLQPAELERAARKRGETGEKRKTEKLCRRTNVVGRLN